MLKKQKQKNNKNLPMYIFHLVNPSFSNKNDPKSAEST